MQFLNIVLLFVPVIQTISAKRFDVRDLQTREAKGNELDNLYPRDVEGDDGFEHFIMRRKSPFASVVAIIKKKKCRRGAVCLNNIECHVDYCTRCVNRRCEI